ncbi:hypothetical protein [Amycolatopsis sp. NPDC003676]
MIPDVLDNEAPAEVFAGLDEIDWAAMEHAYGPAGDVPGLLRGLASADPAVREVALDGMYGAVHHQGDVYECTVAAVPFLVRVAACPGLPGRAAVLRLLASIGGAEQPSPPVDRDRMRYGQAASAVGGAAGALLPLLADPDAEVREAVGATLLARRSEVAEVAAAVQRRLAAEAVPAVAAALVATIGTFARRSADVDLSGVRAALAEPGPPKVRLAALAALARSGTESLSDERLELAVELLTAQHATPEPVPEPVPFETLPGAPPTLAGELRKRKALHRSGLPEDLDPYGPSPVRELSWAFRDQVGDRLRLLAGLTGAAGRQCRLDAQNAASDLVRGWRGDYRELAVRIGENALDEHPLLAGSAVTALAGFGVLAAPAADALSQALDAMPREAERSNPLSGQPGWLIKTSRPRGSGPARVSVDLNPILPVLAELRDVRALPALRWVLEQEQLPAGIGSAISSFGELAADLVPLVRRRMPDFPGEAEALAGALGEMGAVAAEAVPEMVALLSNGKTRETVPALGKIGPGAAAAVPALRSLLGEPDRDHSIGAAVALWRITGDADVVLPAIARRLDGSEYAIAAAAEALGALGQAATSYRARLRTMLAQADDESDPYRWVRYQLATALWRIDGDADAAAAVLVTLWRTNRVLMPALARGLAELGPAARPAAPLARAELDSVRRHTVQGVVEYFDVYNGFVTADESLLADCRTILANTS